MSAKSSEGPSDDYLAIYAVFKKFLASRPESEEREALLEEMMTLRAGHVFCIAVEGFGMTVDEAVELLRAHNDGLTREDIERAGILAAALDNLVDFAVSEEYQMVENLPDDIAPDDEEYEDYIDECDGVFDRYNETYAEVENGDIDYAMAVAAGWVAYSENTVLTYMTQGDDRVRPWHAALEGTSYRKAEFPAWLIPPIEHGCRCYLVEEGADALGFEERLNLVNGAVKIEKPDFISPVFEESVCRKGRIFGKAHSYFNVKKKDVARLRAISKKIKQKWLE